LCAKRSRTAFSADHSGPGSSIFLFEGKQTVNAGDSGFKSSYVGTKRIFRYLHCGDFRACPKMVLHPAIARARIDTCYLDTTYLNPKYCFPPQPQVIDACATLARRTCVGLPESAPALVDLKPPVKVEKGEDGVDVKPDLTGYGGAAEERGKAMMQGWLVKKEEVKAEEKEGQGRERPNGRTLVVMGTYSIGKERIVKGQSRVGHTENG
jgi:DNA cross-link repair 1A protein